MLPASPPRMTGNTGQLQPQQQQQNTQIQIQQGQGQGQGQQGQQQGQELETGVLYCWGEKYTNRPSFNSLIPNIVGLQSGFSHTIALNAEGEVYTWGDNRSSQLGVTSEAISLANRCADGASTKLRSLSQEKNGAVSSSPFTHSPVPVPISPSVFNGQRVKMIAAGGCYTAVVLENGLLYTWGTLDDTHANGKALVTPTKVDLLKGVSCVALGLNHVAVIAETGTPERRAIYTWGSNRKGQLGVLGDSITNAPRKVTLSGARAIAVSCGDEFTVAIVEGNEVFVWGNNRAKQIASNTTDEIISIPMKPFIGRDIVEVSSSRNYIAARTGAGNICLWGNNEHICRAGEVDKIMITLPNRVKQVSAGITHVLALTDKGEVYVMGAAEDGQLGTVEDKKPVTQFKKIAAMLEGRNVHFVHAWARSSSAILEPGNFKVEIGETMRRPENVDAPAPYFLRRLIHYIRGDNAKKEGVFRLSGSKYRVDELEGLLDSSKYFSMSNYEVFDAADNIKRYFKGLPEPIFTNSLCAKYEKTLSNTDDIDERRALVKEWIAQLPRENRVLLIYLLSFLDEVVDTQLKSLTTTAMSAKNLALVFAPNLLTKGEIGNDDVIELMINMYNDIIVDYPEMEGAIIIDQAVDCLGRNSRKVPYAIDLWTRTISKRENARLAFFEPKVLSTIVDMLVDGTIDLRGGGGTPRPPATPSTGIYSPHNDAMSPTLLSYSSPVHSPKMNRLSAVSPLLKMNGNTSPLIFGSVSSPQLVSLQTGNGGGASQLNLMASDVLKHYEQVLSLLLSPIVPIKSILKVLPSIVEINVNDLFIKLLLELKFVRCITSNITNNTNELIATIKNISTPANFNEHILSINASFETLSSDILYIDQSLKHWTTSSPIVQLYANQILEYFKWWQSSQQKLLSEAEEKVLRWKKDMDKAETEKAKYEKQLAQLEATAIDSEAARIKREFDVWSYRNQIEVVSAKMDYNASQMQRFSAEKSNLQHMVDAFKQHSLSVEEFVNACNNSVKAYITSLEGHRAHAAKEFPQLSNQYFDLIFKHHQSSSDQSKHIQDSISKLSIYFNTPSPLISLELETKYNSIKKLV
ncbi:hypothetical protein SAMD00019534_087710 [Acytostelium subglobosum LB1]|uniref:hypothetical protein n=1 Tax=Acytostelium subglobosum LB1 TaxID=1410327 RepID=UPI000644BCBD|nr:hypothetical protein SAMD00019534_087710 [Acytostelium subglobosum LB1]GAM25596.1 hypothetical protein SAMD00019534_087710 [Acytostelium subglobosum LB1]|eukprot:XP_012751582.1 hypothetical protein SAMD00019534_087710 [Acytostelium subglobosum LB1]